METYWSEIEYRYAQSGSGDPPLKGGFVYAFVEASDVRDALGKFTAAMAAEQLWIDRVVYVSPYGDTSWQKDEDQHKFAQLVNAARSTNEVVFDEFYAFQND